MAPQAFGDDLVHLARRVEPVERFDVWKEEHEAKRRTGVTAPEGAGGDEDGSFDLSRLDGSLFEGGPLDPPTAPRIWFRLGSSGPWAGASAGYAALTGWGRRTGRVARCATGARTRENAA